MEGFPAFSGELYLEESLTIEKLGIGLFSTNCVGGEISEFNDQLYLKQTNLKLNYEKILLNLIAI